MPPYSEVVRSVAGRSRCLPVVVVDQPAEVALAHDHTGGRWRSRRRHGRPAIQGLMGSLSQVMLNEEITAGAEAGLVHPHGFAQNAVLEGLDESLRVAVLPRTSHRRALDGDAGQAGAEGWREDAVMVHADPRGLVGWQEASRASQGHGASRHEFGVGLPGGDADDHGHPRDEVDGDEDMGRPQRTVSLACADDGMAEVDGYGVRMAGLVSRRHQGLGLIVSASTVGRRWDAVASQDIADAAGRDRDCQSLQGIADASSSPGIVAPGVLRGNGQDQRDGGVIDAWPAARPGPNGVELSR